MKRIALLGSTGSIGKQVLQIVDKYPNEYKIVSLSANTNYQLFEAQMAKYLPKVGALSDSESASHITSVPNGTTFYYGENASLHAVDVDCDIVFVAIMGFAGLKCVLEAIKNKKTVAIANKETLVAGGELVTSLADKMSVELLPVDSEHSAIWQSLGLDRKKPFEKLIITASGGAFRDLPIDTLYNRKAEEALKHPNWQMGKKITIDCATMVNKGFEVIEAKWLFNTTLDKIEVLCHPESIVHSMVEFKDGGIIGQMGNPNMILPISLAMSYPNRLYLDNKLDLMGKTLHFNKIDYDRYPCFPLVIKSCELGGGYPCLISAGNEEVVKLYLQDKIKYGEIFDYLSELLTVKIDKPTTYQDLCEVDKMARAFTIERYNKRCK